MFYLMIRNFTKKLVILFIDPDHLGKAFEIMKQTFHEIKTNSFPMLK